MSDYDEKFVKWWGTEMPDRDMNLAADAWDAGVQSERDRCILIINQLYKEKKEDSSVFFIANEAIRLISLGA